MHAESRPRPCRAVVTGGAGFIGHHLVRRLVEMERQVVVIDDLSTGRRERLEDLRRAGHVTLRVHDVRHPWFVPADEIYNLASPASPVQYRRAPTRTTLTNVLGAWHAVQAAAKGGARLVQASTSEVYGDPEQHPQTEAYRGAVDPVGPRACYDEGKRCAEALLTDAAQELGVSVRIARIFNTYGPGMALDDGRVVVTFLRQAALGEPLTVFGDGRQTRSFCYIDDLVDGLVAMMACDPPPPGPVNLGNPVEHTVSELADAVASLVGDVTRVHRPLPPDDPARRCPDIARARAHLGFEPRVGLVDGLRHTLVDVRAQLVSTQT